MIGCCCTSRSEKDNEVCAYRENDKVIEHIEHRPSGSSRTDLLGEGACGGNQILVVDDSAVYRKLVEQSLSMGQHDRSEALFYSAWKIRFRRAICCGGSKNTPALPFAFVRERLEDSYSDTGRPSIDPELLLRTRSRQPLLAYRSEGQIGSHHREHSSIRLA